MTRTLIQIFFLFAIASSCQDVFEIPKPPVDIKLPVIEAIITNSHDLQKVRVSYTNSFDDTISGEPINNAHVMLISENSDTSNFTINNNGWYTCNNLALQPNNKYELEVKIDNISYYSSSILLPIHELDSVTYFYGKKDIQKDSAYYLKLHSKENVIEQSKYYQIHLYKNGQLTTVGSQIIIFSDFAIQFLDEMELPIPFSKNDTVDVELYSLNENTFYYYLDIYNNILFNINFDLEHKTNPPSQFTPTALGYFQLSAISRERVIIR